MRLFSFLLSSFVLLGVASELTAQDKNVLISEPVSIRNDFGYEIIGRLKDRILLFRDRSDDYEVQAYDVNMRLSWSRTLNDIEKRGSQILAVISSKNDFCVIFKMRRRGNTSLYLFKYDPGAVLIDSMLVKDYGERLFSTPALDMVRSEDQKTIAVFNTAERGLLEISCFRTDRMEILWESTYPMPTDFMDSQLKGIQLSNDGEMYVVSEYFNRRGRLDRHEMQIQRISEKAGGTIVVPLEEKYTTDVKFIIDNQNKQLVAGGLYGMRNRERSNGIFYLAVPFNNPDYRLKYTEFDPGFMSVLRQKETPDDKGVQDADVSHLVLRKDGGVLVIAERHHEIQRGAAAGRGFWRDGMRVVVDFYFDDLFAAALSPSGELLWNTVLHKKQYSQDDEGTYSSYFLLRDYSSLRFLFNDEIKYENTCSEYLLSPMGRYDRNSLLNTFSKSLRLRFRDGIQIGAGECIIPSEFRNKLRLVLLQT